MRVHPEVTPLTDAKEWSRGLDAAETFEDLKQFVARWSPFVPDAAAVVVEMTEDDFVTWRLGLSVERAVARHTKAERVGAARAEWFERYGALVMPTLLADAALLSVNLHQPFGSVLLRNCEKLLAARGYA